MTTEQIELTRGRFKQVNPISGVAARIFNSRLSKLRALSKGEMREQGRKLMRMIGMDVLNLELLDELLSGLRALGARHAAAYGVHDEDYETLGAALLGTLEASPSLSFTPNTQEKWWRM